MSQIENRKQMRNGSLENMSTEEIFNAAVNVVNSLPKNGYFQPSNELKLKFYSYFKQATDGPNKTSKPAFYDIVGAYKWEAWKKLGNMSKEEAMKNYIDSLQKIVETMSYSDQIKDFYEVLGPFYTDNSKKNIKQNNEDLSSDNDDETLRSNINYGDNKENIEISTTKKVNGIQNGNSDVESETEEFSDTLDHIGSDESNGSHNDHEVITARGESDINSLRINQNLSSNRPSTSRVHLNRDMTSLNSSIFTGNLQGSGSGGNSNQRFSRETNGVQEDLALAILRLQQNLHQISNRLQSIENKIIRSVNEPSMDAPSWKKYWPFSVCPRTMSLLLAWPFIAAIIINSIQNKKNKRALE